jgi:hypothetical protein
MGDGAGARADLERAAARVCDELGARLPMLRSSPLRIIRSYSAANTKSQRCSPWTVPAAAVA